MYYPGITNGILNIITYNVCWEALQCESSRANGSIDMSHCCSKGDKTQNVCVKNIAEILIKGSDKPFDFMALQEIREDKPLQWPTLLKQIKLFMPDFESVYSVASAMPNISSGIMLIYSNRFTLKKNIVGDLLTEPHALPGRTGRPYQIVVFNQGLIYINVHLPHRNELRKTHSDLEEIIPTKIAGELKRLPEYNDPNYQIILSGDFNIDPRKPIDFVQKFLDGSSRKFYVSEKDIGTCCDPIETGKYKYDMLYDHIFNTIGQPVIYKTIDRLLIKKDSTNNKLISDHLPIIAEIHIQMPSDDAKIIFLEEIKALSDRDILEAINLQTILKVYRKGSYDDRLVVLVGLDELVHRLDKKLVKDMEILDLERCIRKYRERFANLDLAAEKKIVPVPNKQVCVKKDKCIELNTPRNQRNSCYLNSTLWALLHRHNNPFLEMIRNAAVADNEIPANKDCDKSKLKDLILDYHNAIHSSTKYVNFPIAKIRSYIQDCTLLYYMPNEPYFWTDKQLDNNEFLRKLLDQFKILAEYHTVKKIIKKYTVPDGPHSIPIEGEKIETYKELVPMYDWTITDNPKLINTFNDETGELKIVSPAEEIELIEPIDFGTFSGIYKKVQIITCYQRPKFLIVNINRSSFSKITYRPIKITDKVELQSDLGGLRLSSIVVHHGTTSSSGHYICYFMCDGKWFLMDDTHRKVEEVDINNRDIENDITTNCTTLVYFNKI